MSNTKAVKITYSVHYYIAFDAPELRGPSFKNIRRGATSLRHEENLSKESATNLVNEIVSGQLDFMSECVISVKMVKHTAKFDRKVIDMELNKERWDACCAKVQSEDWAA